MKSFTVSPSTKPSDMYHNKGCAGVLGTVQSITSLQ